jgi:hypothetical protein
MFENAAGIRNSVILLLSQPMCFHKLNLHFFRSGAPGRRSISGKINTGGVLSPWHIYGVTEVKTKQNE